eukprot:GHVP01060780.1.p1 GENE.GHVP01060780.1~~GHVP01060780.1.p1  ORF type:complete len:521 (-),score=84.63 GHVP01060780.1:3-1565(-)
MLVNIDGIKSYLERTEKRKYVYGTSGIRENNESLDYASFICGVFGCYLSATSDIGISGVMITASHNPEEDNGLKIVGDNGEMIKGTDVDEFCELVNSDELCETIVSLFSKLPVSRRMTVIVGFDTRVSGDRLADHIKQAVQLCGGEFELLGRSTTPLLHEVVYCGYLGIEMAKKTYIDRLIKTFEQLGGDKVKRLLIDCANGIGSEFIPDIDPKGKIFKAFNKYSEGKGLNQRCGADYILLTNKEPDGLPEKDMERCASLDGDADRCVYFYFPDGKFQLINGDKIAVLFALYIKKLVKESGLDIDVAVIQTAYSNGASTAYLESKGIETVFAKTGVVNLHAKAVERDIGVYFEANGHGTVLFSLKTRERILKTISESSESQKASLQVLSMIFSLLSQIVGDAFANILCVETILLREKTSTKEWDEFYQDRPCKQTKIAVYNKDLYVVDKEDETILLEPEGLHAKIQRFSDSFKGRRAFLRPSGTEDFLRLYVEAQTYEEVLQLPDELTEIIKAADKRINY